MGKEQKEKTYPFVYTKDELIAEAQQLENDEDVQLALKVESGRVKIEKLNKIVEVLEEK